MRIKRPRAISFISRKVPFRNYVSIVRKQWLDSTIWETDCQCGKIYFLLYAMYWLTMYRKCYILLSERSVAHGTSEYQN